MHPADITAALKKRGSSQSAVARAVRGRSGGPVTAGAVHLVIKGSATSKAIAQKISEITGLPIASMWPGKYIDLVSPQPKRRGRSGRAT